MLMIYQIPLTRKAARISEDVGEAGMRDAQIEVSMTPQGPWHGLENAVLQRDMRGPIRLTAQIYKVVS